MNRLLDALRNLFGDLAPRERMLLGVVGMLAVVVLGWLCAVTPRMASIDEARPPVQTEERDLAVAARVRDELVEIQGRLQAVERRISSGPSGNLFTILEDLAKQSSVAIESMEPQAAATQDRYKETKVQVSLKEVTLAQATNFLHRIESAPQLLSIKSLRVRTRKDKPAHLDVTFTVSSFETKG